VYPSAQIQTLEEVLEFIKCYGKDGIEISLEVSQNSPQISITNRFQTKVDIRFPTWTPPVEVYIDNIVPVLKKHDMFERTILQSFDWRSLVGIKEKFPDARVGALIDETLVEMVEGIWGMDWITAAYALGAEVISPHHGSRNATGDAGGTINQLDYVPFTTRELVEKAHGLGMMVTPWTIDDESTIEKVIE
jgi:glycerophosphoryl diester phosphodiesterase